MRPSPGSAVEGDLPLPDPSVWLRVRRSEETDVKKSRFNEAQIIGVLREQGAGRPTAEVCRRHGISYQPLGSHNDRETGGEQVTVPYRRLAM